MKALHFDAHIGVHQEIKWILNKLFPEGLELTSLCISDHCHIIGRERDKVEIVNEKTWLDLSKSRVEEFRRIYRDYLKQFDLFIVGHPCSFALLFFELDKPVLMYNTCRSDLPYCWTKDWEALHYYNESLEREYKRGTLCVVANNLADQAYTSLAPHGISPVFLPTIGAYKQLPIQAEMRNNLLSFGNISWANQFCRVENITQSKSLGEYDDGILGEFRAIIHIPKDISLMSIFEQYSSGIPLIFPSINFYRNLAREGIVVPQSRYWLHGTNNQYPGYLKPAIEGDWVDWWLSRADFFNHLNIVNYFDSIEDFQALCKDPIKFLFTSPSPAQLNVRNSSLLLQWKSLFKQFRLIN